MEAPIERRVVITGLGAVSPLGLTAAATWAGLLAGRSGIGPVTLVDAADLPVRIAGEVPGFDPVAVLGVPGSRRADRFVALAVAAAREARADAGLEPPTEHRRSCAVDPRRIGTSVASGLGGLGFFERELETLSGTGPRRVSPYLMTTVIGNAAVAAVALDAGARGPSLCPTTACAAGTDALGLGADMIRLGRADVVLAGGADAPVTRGVLAGFAAMRAASRRNDEPERASRPFSATRDGFVTAEGAAVLVLEELGHARARGANVLSEVVGYAAASDAYHVTAPRPDGAGAAEVMRLALAAAGRAPADVGYVNAHGTSTVANDAVEACALLEVLPAGVPVSSTKSMTGHLMGAAGALEALVCVQVLRTGWLPPTINAEQPDPSIRLDIVAQVARAAAVDLVMSNSFGFGGHDACLLLARA